MPQPSPKTSAATNQGIQVPLRWRLPNPPAIFVGRTHDLDRLESMIERAAVTIVTGPGGQGKSALVSQTLTKRTASQSVIRIGMRPSDTLAQLCISILKAAFACVGRSARDWSDAAQSTSMLLSTLLEMAEENALILVIEDLHHGPDDEMDSFLILLHQYAVSSRWVMTTRRDPQLADVQEQIFHLGPLSLEDTFELGRRCRPDRTDTELMDMASAAKGSPWRVRQILSGRNTERLDGTTLLADLDARSTALVKALALLELPLPIDTMKLVTEMPEPEVLITLVDQGLLEPRSDRLRLHDQSRTLIQTELDEADTKRLSEHLVAGLQDDRHSGSRLEALRLSLLDDATHALDILGNHGNHLIHKGHAPRLWQMIGQVKDERLDHWRYQLALHLASGAAMRWALAQPEPADSTDRIPWLTLHFMAGRGDAAKRGAIALGTEAKRDGRPDLYFTSQLLCHRVLMQLGDPEAARSALENAEPPSEVFAHQKHAFLARAEVLCGRYKEGLSLAQGVSQHLDGLPLDMAHDIRGELASTFIFLGRIRDARRVLAETNLDDVERRPVPSISSRIRSLFLAVRRGEFTEAQRLITSLGEGGDTASMLSIFVRVQLAAVSMALGDFQRAEETLDVACIEAEKSGNAYMYHWNALTRLLLSWHRGEHWVKTGHPLLAATSTGPQAEAFRAYQRAQAIRFDTPYAVDTKDTPVIEANIVDAMASAEAALIQGQPAEARQFANKAHSFCRDHELGFQLADALRVQCDIALIHGTDKHLISCAHALRDNRPESRHYAPLAAFYEAIAQPKHLSGHSVLKWAKSENESPLLAARCRTFLGLDETPRHRLDQVILAALRIRLDGIEPKQLGLETGIAWGLDVGLKTVWIEDYPPLEFGRHALFVRLLQCLAHLGGSATKAQLATNVWEVQAYHPFNDDKRIQVAIRRLRQRLAKTGSKAAFIVTTEDGYAIGPQTQFIRI